MLIPKLKQVFSKLTTLTAFLAHIWEVNITLFNIVLYFICYTFISQEIYIITKGKALGSCLEKNNFAACIVKKHLLIGMTKRTSRQNMNIEAKINHKKRILASLLDFGSADQTKMYRNADKMTKILLKGISKD